MFIEISTKASGTKVLLNKYHITTVMPVPGGGTRVEITSDNGQEFYFADETYEEIKSMLIPVKEITVTIPRIAGS